MTYIYVFFVIYGCLEGSKYISRRHPEYIPKPSRKMYFGLCLYFVL